MAPKRAQVNKFDYKKLTALDVRCPLCRGILIKPITLPCTHSFCAACFDTSTESANIVCPLCRVRVGSWLRSASKSKKLTNETLWQAIQDSFPSQVRNKLNGIEENTPHSENKPVARSIPANTITERKPESTEKPSNNVLSLAKKEFTCRILCQNDCSQEPKTLSLIQKKHRRIQKITEAALFSDRSNSIESECLYFKPIDHRHNPPSEGLAPIKVPTRKPNVSSNIKILAPCGQNQINLNYLESAFARLWSPLAQDVKEPQESTESENNVEIAPVKRKVDKAPPKARKRAKTNSVPIEIKQTKVGDIENNAISLRKPTLRQQKIQTKEAVGKRNVQEKADFELAKKLQQYYNQFSQYSTRSAALKGQVMNIQGMMTPYKVK